MQKIAHERQVKALKLPQAIDGVVKGITASLDDNYGADRHWKKDLGGIVLLLDSQEDLEALATYNLDPNNLIPEYVDIIETEEDTWLIALILLSSDYSVTLVMPMHLAPLSVLNEAMGDMILEPMVSYG